MIRGRRAKPWYWRERRAWFVVADGRLTIDNAPAEQAIRPLCIGRRNWLHLGGDGELKPTAILLSVVASAKRAGVNPWAYLTHLLTELPDRSVGVDLTCLLPDKDSYPSWIETPMRSTAAVPDEDVLRLFSFMSLPDRQPSATPSLRGEADGSGREDRRSVLPQFDDE